MVRVLFATLALLTVVTPALAQDNDLRDLRVGMPVAELPQSGYLGFFCAGAPDKKLAGWSDYRQCPADTSGERSIRFRYDESANPLAKVNGLYEGTKVGGHPVLLTLMIGGNDHVDGMVIETDPAARLYLRKKAFLFGEQVKSRFGDQNWACTSREPTADEEPVGGVFLNEHCQKLTPTRRLTLDRALFRHPGQPINDFVSRSRLDIRDHS